MELRQRSVLTDMKLTQSERLQSEKRSQIDRPQTQLSQSQLSQSQLPQSPLPQSQLPQIEQPQSQLPQNQNQNQNQQPQTPSSESQPSHPPRKRSKVSRACDACRKKKIKCTTTINAPSKCDHCTKNHEQCTFSRVPLKRGPSKGYIRDLEERAVPSPGGIPVSSGLGSSPAPGPGPGPAPALPSVLGPGPGPGPAPVSAPPSAPSAPSQPIILPPLASSPKIQGPFWKVPYEMPPDPGPDRTPAPDSLSRRSSLDSISSTSTTNSRSRLPSLRPSVSASDGPSDTDDDYYSAASYKPSRNSSISLLPLNSSLSSLNGRVHGVSLTGPGAGPGPSTLAPLGPTGPGPTGPGPMGPGPGAGAGAGPDPAALHANLRVYYAQFHSALPILPLSDRLVAAWDVVAATAGTAASASALLHGFARSVDALAHYHSLTLADALAAYVHMALLYPSRAAEDEAALMLYLGGLAVLSYAVLLSGHVYPLVLATAVAALDDSGAVQDVGSGSAAAAAAAGPVDDTAPFSRYLARVYYCVVVVDQYYALAHGRRKVASPDSVALARLAVPPTPREPAAFAMAPFMDAVLAARDGSGGAGAALESTASPFLSPSGTALIPPPAAAAVSLALHYHHLHVHLVEMARVYRGDRPPVDVADVLFDHQLKLFRVLKSVARDLVALSLALADAVVLAPHHVITPYLNCLMGRSFTIIKAGRLIIESILPFTPAELLPRIGNINQDLITSYQHMNSVFNHRLLSHAAATVVAEKVNGYGIGFGLGGGGVERIEDWGGVFAVVEFVERERAWV